METASIALLGSSSQSRPSNQGRNHWKPIPAVCRSGPYTHVAPLTRGGIIGNDGLSLRDRSVIIVAPLTRGGIIGNRPGRCDRSRDEKRSRPSNQGRNHWKHRRENFCDFDRGQVAPLTRGGIIGNPNSYFLFRGSRSCSVAPLTRGGIIGNSPDAIRYCINWASCRPSNQGRNHWKLDNSEPNSYFLLSPL